MPSYPLPNLDIPNIPQPTADMAAVVMALKQLKQAIDSLAGNLSNGKPTHRAVTFEDLIQMTVITRAQATDPGWVPNVPFTASERG